MNEARMDGRRIAVLFFCFCSGCCSLIYQMVWIRLFSLTLGSTLLSVSFVTSMFFLGLALGSRLGGRLAEGRRAAAAAVRSAGSADFRAGVSGAACS